MYYEWRVNQELERRVWFGKQDADVAGLAVRQILNREQEQDLVMLENIIQRGKDSEAQGLATESLELRDRTRVHVGQPIGSRGSSTSLKALIAGTKVAVVPRSDDWVTSTGIGPASALRGSHPRFRPTAPATSSIHFSRIMVVLRNRIGKLQERSLCG